LVNSGNICLNVFFNRMSPTEHLRSVTPQNVKQSFTSSIRDYFPAYQITFIPLRHFENQRYKLTSEYFFYLGRLHHVVYTRSRLRGFRLRNYFRSLHYYSLFATFFGRTTIFRHTYIYIHWKLTLLTTDLNCTFRPEYILL
jgi:hypothetical protein